MHPETRPAMPPDEDEELHARRLVAQRCLYGVDRNPLAADLARLSLWLATLARDHEFTFLDHALKSGDSLVGLTRAQIAAAALGRRRAGRAAVRRLRARPRAARRRQGRARNPGRAGRRERARSRRRGTARWRASWPSARLLGDAVLAAFFGADKPRAREAARRSLSVLAGLAAATRSGRASRGGCRDCAAGEHPLRPFHWEIEFPEVFAGDDGGFDAIVGNPPFAGKNTLINGNRDTICDWLQTLHAGAHGNADLVAHFFRRAFGLLRQGRLLRADRHQHDRPGRHARERAARDARRRRRDLRATRRLPWPGEAAVVVSRGPCRQGRGAQPGAGRAAGAADLGLPGRGRPGRQPGAAGGERGQGVSGHVSCSAWASPSTTTRPRKGKASPVAEMHRLIAKDPRNAERIFPYLGGEEVNTDPRHAHRRWCIDFNDFPLRRERGV